MFQTTKQNCQNHYTNIEQPHNLLLRISVPHIHQVGSQSASWDFAIGQQNDKKSAWGRCYFAEKWWNHWGIYSQYLGPTYCSLNYLSSWFWACSAIAVISGQVKAFDIPNINSELLVWINTPKTKIDLRKLKTQKYCLKYWETISYICNDLYHVISYPEMFIWSGPTRCHVGKLFG